MRCGFGSCGSHALFGLMQADHGDEGDADEAIDSEMHAIGQHSEYTEMVICQQRQYKSCDACHDRQPECQTIAATQAKQKWHCHEVNTNEGEQ